jgi:hypothetical protein
MLKVIRLIVVAKITWAAERTELLPKTCVLAGRKFTSPELSLGGVLILIMVIFKKLSLK